jgi:hypothetical protein
MKKKWNGRPVTVNSREQPSKKPKNEQPADEQEKYEDYKGNPYGRSSDNDEYVQ